MTHNNPRKKTEKNNYQQNENLKHHQWSTIKFNHTENITNSSFLFLSNKIDARSRDFCFSQFWTGRFGLVEFILSSIFCSKSLVQVEFIKHQLILGFS